MYRLIANPNFIKNNNRESNSYDNNLYLLTKSIKKQNYKINYNDVENILNLIEDYYIKKTARELVYNLIDECISMHSDKT